MTDWLIILFFGCALVIGVYFTWVLLKVEMDGRPKPPPTGDDFGFRADGASTPSHHLPLSRRH